MRIRFIVSVAVVAIALTACGGGDAEAVSVSGYVHAGPTCPVVKDPPDPACDDRPVPGAVIEFSDEDGRVAATATSNQDGTFSVELGAGRYDAVPQPVDGLLGTASSATFHVDAEPVSLDFAYDTGIR